MENAAQLLASVDLGSNSFRLQICQNNNGQPQVVENIKQMVRFAGGLDANKNLSEESQERALECLAQFGERLRGFAPEQVRAVATNTFRVAKNIAQFLPKAEAALGFPIEVIAGREEARLIYTGVIHTYPKRFFQNKISQKDFQAAVTAARGEIQRISKIYKQQGWDIALGTSGSAKSIATVIAAQDMGERITLDAMRVLANKIADAGSVKKAKLEGIKPERVEVFAGGLAVMMAAFEELDIAGMAFNEAGLRDGVFFDTVGRNVNEDLREQTVRQFQERYHVSTNQAQRVSQLALQFLRNLAQTATVQELDYWSNYVRWAAQLHEVGVDIAHTAYHKHSAYVLANADMSGFSRQEQELLAMLTLGQRSDLKKMADTLSRSDLMRWHALLALRLAVLFCRARLPLQLPQGLSLQYDKPANRYTLKAPQAWLDNNPLTAAALQEEAEQWQKIEHQFNVVAQ